ncbi:MAG: GLPGLI family protein, partial [Bacteroidales bacterium]|nr:GLPGLI family protein [Bacteroidales bacterium]
HSQVFNGSVKYRTQFTINWHSICQGDPQCISQMENIPNSSLTFWNLDFNENESLYTKIDSIADIENVKKIWEAGMDPNEFDPNQNVYINNINKTVNTFVSYFDFYVSDTLKLANVKIEAEQKDILGYKCIKASTGTACEIWFSPEIPLPYGPSDNYGLPGMILEISCNAQGVHTVITAYEILVNKNVSITKPKAKYVSKTEYEKLIEDLQNR